MNNSPSIVWFRNDLRLADNPALHAAIERGAPVIPVFIFAPGEEGRWAPGGASRWWLHQSLASLGKDLAKVGSRLVLARGASLVILQKLIRETGAGAVYWNRRYEPAIIARDQVIKETLKGAGLLVESFNGALLKEPWTIENKSRKPFQVFTPYWKRCLEQIESVQVTMAPRKMADPAKWPASLPLQSLELEPKINWAGGLLSQWHPGSVGAGAAVNAFLKDVFADYGEMRNRPDKEGTSRLSPHLHFGEISPRQIWDAIRAHAEKMNLPDRSWRNSQFLAELGWREFAHHLLYHFPTMPEEPLRKEFKHFQWRNDAAFLKAWQSGRTGYPIVDAGMRQLWHTGWMHNRVRMIVASFLVKDLLLTWEEGAKWFWDTLVDADLAQNTLGWQWVAGCGADAAPYFRVFNPTTQGIKFDPEGDYIKRWCPELKNLGKPWIHEPGKAPEFILTKAGVQMGANYPEPILNHSIAREVALEAFGRLKAFKQVQE